MLPLVFLVADAGSHLLRSLLEANNYVVRALPVSTEVVMEAASRRRPALFLIDAPPASSLKLCLTIRQDPRLRQTPVVILSKGDSEDDRIRGFDLGADDFVTKPLRPREIVARINAVMRRSAHPLVAPVIEVGGIEVDTERFVLSVRGTRVGATAMQVRLVEYLMRNEGRVFSRDQILDALWSDSRFVTPRTIDVHVRRIRELIEPNPSKPTYLKTIRGVGYSFVAGGEQRLDAHPSSGWIPPQSEGRVHPLTARASLSRLRSAS